jgi:hypothetical protein
LNHHGNLKAHNAFLDVAHAGPGERHGLDLVDAHLVDQVRLIAQCAAKIFSLTLPPEISRQRSPSVPKPCAMVSPRAREYPS